MSIDLSQSILPESLFFPISTLHVDINRSSFEISKHSSFLMTGGHTNHGSELLLRIHPKPSSGLATELPALPLGSRPTEPFPKKRPAQHAGRLNRFVRRLHGMLVAERNSGVVEWRRGLLVLHNTDIFAETILPQYFSTKNFKTFRRQLNYYGFVHVRSFTTTGSCTTALWVNQELAQAGSDDVAFVLSLRRVEPSETDKSAERRRVRKEQAIHTVEEDFGIKPKIPQDFADETIACCQDLYPVPLEIHCSMSRNVSLGSASSTVENVDQGSSTSTCKVYDDSSSDEEGAANVLLQLSRWQ